MVKKIRILYLVLPVILLLGIYGSQSSYEKSGYFEPYKNQKSNGIMTMSIDNTSYEQGETINVLGKVTKSSENVSVLIKVIDPTKNTVGEFHGVVNQFGIFNVFFEIPDTFSSGKYILTAYYEGDSKKTLVSFDITISNIPSGVSYISIPNGASVEGNNLNFVPPKAIVPVGTKIIWINNDVTVHTVINGKVLDSGALVLDNFFQGGFIKPGQTIETSLNSGNYTYFCKIHPWLGGTISVTKIKPTTKPTTPATKPTTPATKPTTPATKPTTPATKPTTPATKPTTPATKPTTPATKPTTPATKPTTPTTTTPPSATPTQSAGSENFLSSIWKGLLSLFTGGASSSFQHNNTNEPTPSQTAKPAPSPTITKPAPSTNVKQENNGPDYFYNWVSTLNNWKIIYGDWKGSKDGLHGGNIAENDNQIILSPISSKNFTLDTSFRVLDANQTIANYVSIVNSWRDTKNYELAEMVFVNHHVYVSYITVKEGITPYSDSTWPGKATGLSWAPGNLFSVTFSKQGKSESLTLNGTKYLHSSLTDTSGYIGLHTGRMHDVVFDHIRIHKLDK